MTTRTLQGATGPWEMVIGMEVHAQVSSKAKLFSRAATAFGAEPNTQVSLIDAAMPGMLPVINERCIEQAVRTGLGLFKRLGPEAKNRINLRSVFDRKNYFYPDLPQGYQISQFTRPVVGRGEVAIEVDGEDRRIGITRLHLEQDAGKSVHDLAPDATFVDLNRAGVALMEIVSEPDIRSPEEAGAYLSELRSILQYLGTCDGNMEEGSMRADVNVSVRRPGEDYGTRCEIKNVNSIRFVQQAILYEARRQIDVIEGGGKVVQETRLFDANRGETRSMRSKEEAHDYRYFPDPDLLPLELDAAWVENIWNTLPELCYEKRIRWNSDFGLSFETVDRIIEDRKQAELSERDIQILCQKIYPNVSRKYFELKEVLSDQESQQLKECARAVINMIMKPVFSAVNTTGQPSHLLIPKAHIPDAILYVVQGRLSQNAANTAVEVSASSSDELVNFDEIINRLNLWQLEDNSAIEAAVDQAIAAGAKQVEQYRAGNEKILGWFVGQVMKVTGGKANPAAVNEILRKKLSG